MKIIVGLSGGVDSSVAALLLKQQGHNVAGLFMKNWEEDDKDGICAASKDLEDAQNVATKLGIKLHQVNFASEYWDEVFNDFIAEHKRGRTPNPDIFCNQRIKFKFFLDYALSLGADKIATGHYANIYQYKSGQYQLKTASDINKDQSYFLARLNQYQLSKSLFPLANLTKNKVRNIAKENSLITADKKDSTGICFIGKKNFNSFLIGYIKPKPGNIVDENGNIIKQHQGLAFYTIGQRQGLGIGGGFGDGSGSPWFVADKNVKTNELVVVQGEHHLLYNKNLIANKTHWISKAPTLPISCFAKIRYRQSAQACQISSKDQQLIVEFYNHQRAITPGQFVVFYTNDVCLGSAVINQVLPSNSDIGYNC